MAQLEPYVGDYYLWAYLPSVPAAVIFLLLFLGATIYHFWKLWKMRARFCLAFAIGGIFEVIGYGARAAAYNRTGEILPYCVQNVFILLGPVLFAASVYMTLGRIIRSVQAEHHSLVRVGWLTKVFVLGDVLSFVIQGSAAGLMATGSNAEMGKNIVIVGLLVQVIMFGLFIVTSIVFQRRMHQHPTAQAFDQAIPWKSHLHTLYAVSVLIMVRSIFRVIEYAMGQDGYLLSHEWPMYVFDALLMFAVMVIWGVWYPGNLNFLIQKPASDTMTIADVSVRRWVRDLPASTLGQ
ncbi:RTA1 like protein-domain-containing protein [Aspergillus parasiticus]|uniref:RTA1 like protein-domain-containing protein n=1 Tax=Aspergillus parasiticus TaxID=5067 RepID=A0A5N6DCA6_ASPPA|nr:RTA1 like protein-domain-containing protein [Aspergillus parasiticus]